VAQQTLAGYFRSHPLPSECIAQVQNMIASEGWTARPERDLAVAYIFWTARARKALDENRYEFSTQAATVGPHPVLAGVVEVVEAPSSSSMVVNSGAKLASHASRELPRIHGWLWPLASNSLPRQQKCRRHRDRIPDIH